MKDSTRAKLPERLLAVAGLVPRGAHVVDVGSGDGRLASWLVAHGRAAACIATERGEVAARLPAGPVPVREGDGLFALRPDDRGDVLVLAGLGARSILRILERGRRRLRPFRRLVLQPQTECGRLRRWLVEQSYEIVAERLALDRGRFYVVLAAEPRPAAVRPLHTRLAFDDLMEAGPCLVRSDHPDVCRYWRRALRHAAALLGQPLGGPGRERALRDRDRARRVLAALPAVAPAPPSAGGDRLL